MPRALQSGSPSESLAGLPSRTDAVISSIERSIFDGDYKPGDRLVERELAARLGVSKTPVREALKALAGRGLVVSHPYRGMRVRELHAEVIRNLYEVRLLLEPTAVGESVARRDHGVLVEARTALEAGAHAANSGELGGLVMANRSFHRALCARCPNSLLVSILADLRDQMALIIVSDWRTKANWLRQAEEHKLILEAAETGDAAAAERETRAHVLRAMQGTLSRVTEGDARLP